MTTVRNNSLFSNLAKTLAGEINAAKNKQATTQLKGKAQALDSFSPSVSKVASMVLMGSSPAPAPVQTGVIGRNPDIGNRPDFDQGNTNSCGTTALAEAFHNLGFEQTRQTIDDSIREFDVGTPMQSIVNYAQSQGFQAQEYNNGSFQQLQSDLAAGRQVIVQVDVSGYDKTGHLQPGSPNDFETHYMVVDKAFTGPDGKQYVTYENWGNIETLPYTDFEKLWGNIKEGGLSTGMNNPYILVAKGNAAPLPPSNASGYAAVDGVETGGADVINGVADLSKGRVGEGVGRIVGGVAGGLVSAAGALGQIVSDGLTSAGNSMENTGNDMMHSGNALEEVGGAVVEGAGWFVDGMGTVAGDVGNAIGEVGKDIEKGAEDVGNAIDDAAKSVGNFFSSIF
jgi:hypothetical protein